MTRDMPSSHLLLPMKTTLYSYDAIHMQHDLLTCDRTWLIDKWHDSLTYDVTCRSRTCNSQWKRLSILMTPSTCDMTRWLVTWHDSLTCDVTHGHVTWLMDMWHDSWTCDVTHWHVIRLIDMWHDSLTCDVTHWHVIRLRIGNMTCLLDV